MSCLPCRRVTFNKLDDYEEERGDFLVRGMVRMTARKTQAVLTQRQAARPAQA